MLTNLRDITSLNNLGRKGQVATVLILLMVAVLIFILVTVNVGQTSLTATNLANAADAGTLYLGSQLATKANVLYKSLGNTTQKCQKGGWASLIFAIVLAVIATVATWWAGGTGGYLVLAGALGGAAGGAAGGAYAGTGALRGALTGAIVGAGIGGGVAIGAEAGAGAAGSGLGPEALVAGTGAGTGTAAVLTPTAAATISTGMTVGAVAGGTLSASASVYNKHVDERMTAAAFDAAARALSGLPEYDQYREGVSLQALSRTIDDPNEIQDGRDSDEDGDTEEQVPYFQYWWDERIELYKKIVPILQSLTQGFLNNTDDFVDEITVDECVSYDDESGSCLTYDYSYLSLLSGTISEVGSNPTLKDYGVTFVDSGSLGVVGDDLDNFVTAAKGLLQERANQGIGPLTSTWQTWINLFYDSEAQTPCVDCGEDEEIMDFYRMFELMLEGDSTDPDFAGLEEWKRQIEAAREELPDCQCDMESDEGGSYCVGYKNWPCKTSAGGSIDYDLEDEIARALGDINTIISGINSFQNDIYNFNQRMYAAYTPLEEKGGINPVTYSWTDSRGEHSIEVEAGPYKLARIEVRKSGGFLKKEICLILKDYSDDGSRTWVKITRREPANKELGMLGKWNPVASAADGGFFTITRSSRAAYSFNYIKISGK